MYILQIDFSIIMIRVLQDNEFYINFLSIFPPVNWNSKPVIKILCKTPINFINKCYKSKMNIKAENNYREKTLFLFINTCYGRQHAKISTLSFQDYHEELV